MKGLGDSEPFREKSVLGGKWVSRGSRLTDMSQEENCARKNCEFWGEGGDKK